MVFPGADTLVMVPISEITKVTVSLAETTPVLIININPSGAFKVREALHMTDPSSSYYFDSESNGWFH